MQFKMASDDDCNICFGRIPPDDNKGKGQGCPAEVCKAKFCSKCINTWLIHLERLGKSPTCPLCVQPETIANKKKRQVEAMVAAELKRKLKIGTTLAAIIVGGYASPELLLGLGATTLGAISLYPKPFRDLWYNHFATPASWRLYNLYEPKAWQ